MVKELNTIKKRENEMVEQFNQRFNGLLKDMTQDYKPPDKTVLEQYLEFNVETQYEIRRAKPITLIVAQYTVEELDNDKKASSKLEILGFGRGPVKSKGKEIKEVEHDQIKE